MLKVFKELSLEAGERVHELIRLGAAVQKLRAGHSDPERRAETRRLTRSSALYAVGELDPRVRSALHGAGLDWSAFRELLGLADEIEPTSQKDVTLHENLREALSAFAATRPEGSAVDLPEIALAIVQSVIADPKPGLLPRRLRQLKVDAEAARANLAPLAPAPLVYVSYSHRDGEWKDRLLRHLEPLERQGRLRAWHDGLLEPGSEWQAEIEAVHDRAAAAVLLVSQNYLSSSTIGGWEAPRLLERKQERGLRLLPLAVAPSTWQEVDWLRQLTIFPPGGRGLVLLPEPEREEQLGVFAGYVAAAVGRDDLAPPEAPAERHWEDSVPAHLDDPSHADHLNRRPFAEVMAIRIHDIWGLGVEEAGAGEDGDGEADGGPNSEANGGEGEVAPAPGRGSTNGAPRPRSFAVHIHGPWGAGKTSVLNFMREKLESGVLGEKWVVIDFNAWRHQRLRPPWWTLIRQVYLKGRKKLKQFGDGRRVRRLFWRWHFERLQADWMPAVVAALLILLIVLFVGGPLGLFDRGGGQNGPDLGSVMEKGLTVVSLLLAAWAGALAFGKSLLFGSARAAESYMEASRDPMGPIARLFERLIDAMARPERKAAGDGAELSDNEKGHPVAIFIDDLDRCDGDYVVELLEGIQTLFRRADATYVVAADRKWIRTSFEMRYGDFKSSIAEPGRPLGYLFLEKMFQVSASVPRLSEPTRRAYWQRLLEVAGEAGDGAGEGRERVPKTADGESIVGVEKLESSARQAHEEGELLLGDAVTPDEMRRVIEHYESDPVRQQGIRAAAAKRVSSRQQAARTAHFLAPFASLLEPNPRAMKRLINAYGIHQAVNFLEDREVDPAALALWTIVEMRWPLLADCLTQHPALVAKVGQKTPSKDRRIPGDLRSLFTSGAVRRVVCGEGVPVRLDEDTIKRIVGRSALESSAGVR